MPSLPPQSWSPNDLPQSVTDQLAGWYTQAADRLRQIVLHPPGTKASSQDFHRSQAAVRLDQVGRITTELKLKAADWTGKAFTAAVQTGRAQADAQATAAGIRKDGQLQGSFALIDHGTVATLAHDAVLSAQDAAKTLYQAADSMQAAVQPILRQTAQIGLAESDINRILAGGVIDGTPVQTIRALRDALDLVNSDHIVIAGGRHFDVDYYARLVAITKTREATEFSRKSQLVANGIDLVRITGHTSKTFCTAFLGKVFSISGHHPHYPPLSDLPGGRGPPFHPHCTKSTAAFVEDLATPQQLEVARHDPEVMKLAGKDIQQAQKLFQDLQLGPAAIQKYGTIVKLSGPRKAA